MDGRFEIINWARSHELAEPAVAEAQAA